jgi:hypothetical protein
MEMVLKKSQQVEFFSIPALGRTDTLMNDYWVVFELLTVNVVGNHRLQFDAKTTSLKTQHLNLSFFTIKV